MFWSIEYWWKNTIYETCNSSCTAMEASSWYSLQLSKKYEYTPCKIKAQYNSFLSHGINYCVKESSFPSRLALPINAKVMLIKNYIVEWKVMNGSVGTVVDIVYKNSNGPMKENALPEYVIVDFPYSCRTQDYSKPKIYTCSCTYCYR